MTLTSWLENMHNLIGTFVGYVRVERSEGIIPEIKSGGIRATLVDKER